MESKTIETWSDDQESILKSFAEKAACYRYINYECYTYYKNVDQKFSLPVIILSTLAGSASLGSGNIPTWASIITLSSAVINIITGILGTLQRFLNTAELTSQHFTSSVEYGRLSRDISVMLNLPRSDRSMDGAKFLEQCKNEYNRLVDQTAAPPKFILKNFDKKFKNISMAKPDLVTLSPIQINNKKTQLKNIIIKNTPEKNQNRIELAELRNSNIVRKHSMRNISEELEDTTLLDEGATLSNS